MGSFTRFLMGILAASLFVTTLADPSAASRRVELRCESVSQTALRPQDR